MTDQKARDDKETPVEMMRCEHDWVDGACAAVAPLGAPGWELRTGPRGDQFWLCPQSIKETQ